MNYSEATAVINCPTKTGSLDIPHEKRNTYIWSAKVEMTLFLWYCFKIFAFFLFCFFVLFHRNCNLPNLSEEKDESISRSYRLTLAAFASAINWKLTQVTKNSSRIMAYHVRFTIFRATITNSLNEEKLTKHKSDFASIFLTQSMRNNVKDFEKFE